MGRGVAILATVAIVGAGAVWALWPQISSLVARIGGEKPNVISIGENHVLAVRDDGTLWAWGENSLSQLGQGDQNGYDSPVQVMRDVVSVHAHGNLSYAIKKDGTLWRWGRQLWGGEENLPNKIMDDVRSVYGITDGSVESTFAIKKDGSLWAWESYWGPQRPQKIMDEVRSVHYTSRLGYPGMLAIKNDATLWEGMFGNISASVGVEPPIQIADHISDVTGYGGSILALKDDGTLWKDMGGQPEEIMTDVDKIVAALGEGEGVLALKANGGLWVYGEGGVFIRIMTDVIEAIVHELSGTLYVVKDTGSLWEVDDIDENHKVCDDVLFMDSYNGYTVVMKKDGSLWSWGNAWGYGGRTDNTSVPEQVLFPAP